MVPESDIPESPPVEKNAYFLRTARLGFRLWRAEDLVLACGLWGDPQVMRFIDAGAQLSEQQVRERLTREITTAATHGVQYWPVFLLHTGEHVGCVGLRPYKIAERIYEIGVHLRVQFWGKGFATEAARGVMNHAFHSLRFTALFAGHSPRNEASRHVLLKLGFRYTHDEFYSPAGEDHPSYLLTAKEYDRLLRQ
jgi:RimJ/RimL family protein N-acetyltransferase